jgi:hypothetical protein
VGKVPHARKTARLAAAISGDSTHFAKLLPGFPAVAAKRRPVTTRLRTRRWPGQCSTPSWQAAYNLACAYAAIAANANADGTDTDDAAGKVIRSL